MTRGMKILSIAGASVGTLAVATVITSYAILQSSWFGNYVKNKIVSVAEQSTGGKVEIGRFDVDLNHLTIRIYDFVLHGTEPASVPPLLRAHLLELHLRLFSGIKGLIDLSYIGIERPQVDLISYPDGRTNIPQPKNPAKSKGGNPLQTLVDLKIGQFNLYQGLIQFNQQKTQFQAHGDNLRVLLNYNSAMPGYQGNVSFDPLTLREAAQPPLVWHVNVPVTIESTALRINRATLSTNQSKLVLDASVEGPDQKVFNAKVNADLKLPELARSLDLPIHPAAPGAPKELTAELALHMDQKDNAFQLQTAHIALGQTTLQASGSLRDPNDAKAAAAFNGNLALAQLEPLFGVTSPQASGDVTLNGFARLDGNNNYQVNGTINSKNLSLVEGKTRVADIQLYTPFHADPYLVSLDGLKLGALGGTLRAKVFVENLAKLSVEGNLQHFSLPLLAAVATRNHLGYDGVLSGSLKATGDLKAKGTAGYAAEARLTIAPGRNGVPISGHLNADYSGAHDTVDLLNSDILLPHSRLTLNGPLNRDLKLTLLSKNLNDFLPAVNFGSKHPESSLPVSLQGNGQAVVQADVVGNLSSPKIVAHAALDHFAARGHTFDHLGLDAAANQSMARIQNGVLAAGPLHGAFDLAIGLRKWSPVPSSPLSATVTLQNASVPELLSLAGQQLPVSGDASADIHINGTYGDPLGTAKVAVVNGVAYDQPFDRAFANVTLADRLITIQPLEVATPGGTVQVTGTYHHPRDSFLTGTVQLNVSSPTPVDLSKLKLVQQKSPGTAGIIQLNASASGEVTKTSQGQSFDLSSVAAKVTARSLRVQNEPAGDLTLSADTQGRTVRYQLTSDFAGSDININGHTELATDYPTDAKFVIRNLAASKVLRMTGQTDIPVRGTVGAEGTVSGTIKAPSADLSFSFVKGLVYQEPIDRLAGSLKYTDTAIVIPGIALDVPAGSVKLKGSYRHRPNDLKAGDLLLTVDSSDVDLSRVQHIHAAQPTLAGTVKLALDVAAHTSDQGGKQQVAVSRLNADLHTSELQLQQRDFGRAQFTASTSGAGVDYKLNSDIAKSDVRLIGHSQLTGDYPTRASLTFRNIRYSNLAPFLSAQPAQRPPFDALVEGDASVSGPVLDAKALTGRLELTHLSATNATTPTASGGPPGQAVTIENEGPVVVGYRNQVVDIQQFKLRGPATNVEVTGKVDLKDPNAPMNVRAYANIDLALLQKLSPDVYSSGALTMDAVIHGSFSQPLVNGSVQLRNANINDVNFSNGLSNGNGLIQLTGTGAVIQQLTGQSGGGTISVTGFAGWTGRALIYNIKAVANRVRFRQAGVSVTSNATITAVGNYNRSLIGGNVLVQRIAYGPTGDAGSFLSNFTSTPPSVQSAPSAILTGMRLNIHVLTAPDLRVITTYANKLNVQANLTLRGTAASPGMLGRVTVTEGQLVFFGNTYKVNTGTVNFYSSTSIQPVVNLSLETLAQGVDVTLNVSGPINDLKLTYRSDPPLSFQQIVQLLATNTTPSDPNIAANQGAPPPQQSFTQMGESAVLGQAIANPLASRVQRVFGLSEFKIDPNVAGNGGQPSARVTLQEKITNNLIFTYVNDVTQPNSEMIRVQWDLTPKLSAVGMRDYNSYISVQFIYKWKKQ